jgi:hypothetical protein
VRQQLIFSCRQASPLNGILEIDDFYLYIYWIDDSLNLVEPESLAALKKETGDRIQESTLLSPVSCLLYSVGLRLGDYSLQRESNSERN